MQWYKEGYNVDYDEDHPEERLWKTKAGDMIRISEMEDSHLNNTIAMLERNADKLMRQALSEALALSATMQGEMAIESMEEYINDMVSYDDGKAWLFDTYSQYEWLLEERHKRNCK